MCLRLHLPEIEVEGVRGWKNLEEVKKRNEKCLLVLVW
jgi:hypothetical protein